MFILTSKFRDKYIVFDSLLCDSELVDVSDLVKATKLGIKIIGVELRNGKLRLVDNVTYFNKLKLLEVEDYEYSLDENNLIVLKHIPYNNIVIDRRVNIFDTFTFSDMSGSVKVSGGGGLLNTSMMFLDCDSLIDLDLSEFDTSNVEDMSSMFENCGILRNLDVSGFNISNVNNMSYMFANCTDLITLKLWKYQSNNVENMVSMFYRCILLQNIDARNLGGSPVVNTDGMFQSCVNLHRLDLSNFDVSGLKTAYEMFCDCNSLEELKISKFPSENNINMTNMFGGCKQEIVPAWFHE